MKTRSKKNVSGMKDQTMDFGADRITLRKHAYSNIQKISPPKTETFQIIIKKKTKKKKKNDIFHISAQNIDCGYLYGNAGLANTHTQCF